MRIIYKYDILFTAFYTLLIMIVGAAFVAASGEPVFIVGILVAAGVYLYFALRRPMRRFRALKTPVPRSWKMTLQHHSLLYSRFDGESRRRFEDDIRIFLSDYTVESIRREEVDIKTKLLVAAGFATMLNGRPDWEPPIKDGVLVYPGSTFNRDYVIGKGMLAGQATPNSPLIVTRQSLDDSFSDPGDGYNVIYHELAHYFDLEDGVAEGVPSARMIKENWAHCRSLIHEEWLRVTQGQSFLRDYAGTNEAETFAVAVEAFFETPRLMMDNNSQLYTALMTFFNIDTLGIIESKPEKI